MYKLQGPSARDFRPFPALPATGKRISLTSLAQVSSILSSHYGGIDYFLGPTGVHSAASAFASEAAVRSGGRPRVNDIEEQRRESYK